MSATFKGLLFLACVVVFSIAPPPFYLSAETIEEELAALDQKIQTGAAGPADIRKYNDLVQMFQKQERKKPKNDFLKPKFRLNGHGRFEQGFGMSIAATPTTQNPTCGEFKNIYYYCSALPWDATDGWTRTDEAGEVAVRPCVSDDICTSDGVLVVASRESPFFYRFEEGLVSEPILFTAPEMNA